MEGPSLSEAASSAPAPQSASDKLAVFEDFLDPEEEQEDNTQPEGEEGAEEGEDLALEDEEAGETEDEPETAIEPPVSLNAEEKKAFAAASPEAQQAWAAAETRRNAQVQEATTKASVAQQEAQARAAQADAVAQQEAAKAILDVLQHYQPVEPQRNWFPDDVAYLTACRQYDTEVAQFTQRVQQAVSMEQQAVQAVDQQFTAQREQELAAIVPDYANPATRVAWSEKVIGIGRELGFADTELAALNAQGFKALDEVAVWKAKAERLDKAVAKQMQKVRAAKGKTLRPNAGPQDTRAAKGNQDWGRVKAAKSKESQAEAFADWIGL